MLKKQPSERVVFLFLFAFFLFALKDDSRRGRNCGKSRRSADEIKRFNKIIAAADLVQQINDRYFKACYQVRNEWMVDQSDIVVSGVTHDWGGAATTLKYATRKKKRIISVV